MITFTILEYLIYQKNLQLAEEPEDYVLPIKTHQYHDKIFKDILDDKKELIKFLNKIIKLDGDKRKFDEVDLEKYNRKFITDKFGTRESDIIYKVKDRNVFILIEHQSTKDKTMPERITEYCVEIIRSAMKENVKSEKYPLIYPIVLYTGNIKWDIATSITEKQEEYNGMKKLNIDESKYIKIVLENSKFIRKKLGDNYIKQYIEKLNKEGEKVMFEELFVELVEDKQREGEERGRMEGKKEGRKEGRMEAIKQVVIEMLKNNMKEDMIMKLTKLSEKELEEIKKFELAKNNA